MCVCVCVCVCRRTGRDCVRVPLHSGPWHCVLQVTYCAVTLGYLSPCPPHQHRVTHTHTHKHTHTQTHAHTHTPPNTTHTDRHTHTLPSLLLIYKYPLLSDACQCR